MHTPLELPHDPAGRFREIHDALNAERGWNDASPLRFAALAAISCPGSATSVAAEIRELAQRIHAAAGWFGPMRSSLRYVIAAILLQRGDDLDSFQEEVRRARDSFREAGIRREETYQTISVLILRIQHGLRPIERHAVERLAGIYNEMKRYHWWYTSADDLPACAMLAGCEGSAQRIGERAEEMYQALVQARFAKGGALQNAAHLMAVSGAAAEPLAARAADLAAGFRSANVRIWQSDYDEIAVLALLERPAGEVVERVLRHREAMAALRPKPNRSQTFNLACSMTFLESLRGENMQLLADLKTLLDMQSIIRAQQAAAASAAS